MAPRTLTGLEAEMSSSPELPTGLAMRATKTHENIDGLAAMTVLLACRLDGLAANTTEVDATSPPRGSKVLKNSYGAGAWRRCATETTTSPECAPCSALHAGVAVGTTPLPDNTFFFQKYNNFH